MLKIKRYKDASTRFTSIHVTKWFGIKFEPCLDGMRRKGLSVKGWYPEGRTRLGYWSIWIPKP
jgi:hypothetical protein